LDKLTAYASLDTVGASLRFSWEDVFMMLSIRSRCFVGCRSVGSVLLVATTVAGWAGCGSVTQSKRDAGDSVGGSSGTGSGGKTATDAGAGGATGTGGGVIAGTGGTATDAGPGSDASDAPVAPTIVSATSGTNVDVKV